MAIRKAHVPKRVENLRQGVLSNFQTGRKRLQQRVFPGIRRIRRTRPSEGLRRPRKRLTSACAVQYESSPAASLLIQILNDGTCVVCREKSAAVSKASGDQKQDEGQASTSVINYSYFDTARRDTVIPTHKKPTLSAADIMKKDQELKKQSTK